MIKALVTDFSRVLLSPKDTNYTEGLNALHKTLSQRRDYNFWDYFQLNEDLLAFYKNLKERAAIYIFTTEYIQEHPALQPKLRGIFKEVLSAARLSLKKADPQAYKTIAQRIGLKPEEVLYIDDKQANLDAAKMVGMAVVLYEAPTQAMNDIKKFL